MSLKGMPCFAQRSIVGVERRSACASSALLSKPFATGLPLVHDAALEVDALEQRGQRAAHRLELDAEHLRGDPRLLELVVPLIRGAALEVYGLRQLLEQGPEPFEERFAFVGTRFCAARLHLVACCSLFVESLPGWEAGVDRDYPGDENGEETKYEHNHGESPFPAGKVPWMVEAAHRAPLRYPKRSRRKSANFIPQIHRPLSNCLPRSFLGAELSRVQSAFLREDRSLHGGKGIP
jgi:hypothetical protein